MSLDGLASYIIHYERTRGMNKKSRYLASLPSVDAKRLTELLIYLPENLIYSIKKGKIKEFKSLNEDLIDFIEVIKQYFQNLTFCVLHGKEK